ncbi:MAG: type II toxin-antitoxin system VapC family toxin [Cyanobacteria bacterium J06592_8]
MTRLINAGLFSPEQLENTWIFINNLPILYHSFVMEVRTVEIALSLNRQSAYDAAYIALAETLNAQLWTLDIRLYRNAVGRGLNVNLLTDSQTED